MEEVRNGVVFNIPLQKISFDADVSGTFAKVNCTQEFVNQNDVPVEAIYVFPLPENASVAGCELVIGDKRIEAELKEKAQAEREYQAAVDEGHHAGLLEQKRANIFTISVGGIEPGENIKVVTVYTQKVPWQDNGGRFTIPTVVAPRFIPGVPSGSKTGGGWSDNTDEVPDASEITPVVAKDGVTYTVDIKATLSPGFLCHVSSPSHELIEGLVTTDADNTTRFDIIDIDIDELVKPVEIDIKGLTPDRDFIVCYRSMSDQVEASVHTGSFDNDEYILLDVIPPCTVEPKSKDVIFCLDVSGSMHGAKLEGLKVVAEKVAQRLFQQDERNRVGIVAFSDETLLKHAVCEISDTTYAAIQSLASRGGTYAGAALDHCFQQLSEDEGRERYILFVSDGETMDRWSAVVSGVRVISVGIGTAVDMAYLKDIARETKGADLAVYPGEDYDAVATTLTGYLAGPVLTDIEVIAEGEQVEDVQGIADVYTSMPASLALKLSTMPNLLELSGIDRQGNKISITVDSQVVGACAFAHQIWVREKMRDPALAADILVDLSLKYGVLCAQTAFVAVNIKETPGQKPVRIEIPVALPHTWDYDKVFGTGAGILASAGIGETLIAANGGYNLIGSLGKRRLHSRRSPLGGGINRAAGSPEATGVTSEWGYKSADITDDESQSTSSGPGASVSPSADVGSTAAPIHISDELEALAYALEKGSIERSDITNRLASLVSALNSERAIKLWSASQRAKAFYCLVRIQTFGLRIAKGILRLLSGEPDPADTEAHEWWEKAQREMGVAVSTL